MSEAAQVWKDRYEIERPLGRGGMSAVFLAKDLQLLSKRVVVKVLLDETSQDAWVQQKFLQEMEAMARIDHPGVVGVLDTGTTPEGKRFLVMQYVEGETLRSIMTPGGMELTRAANVVRQVAQALAAAHEKGVWHRDLKPENIMLQRSGGQDYVKLIDFGIAGIQNSQFSGEATKVAGTLAYMAPEQFAGNPCAATDTYALGVLAYEMLTGKLPFASSSMTHLVQDGQTVLLPRQVRADLPAAAEQAIVKAISFHPQARQASVRDFGEEIFQALTGVPAPRPTIRELEIAHVLFADIVDYSLLPIDRQKQYLGELQQVVRDSARFRAAEQAGEMIRLPVADGMALVFFGDPVAAVRCAVEMGAALKSRPHLKLRMGINSGPVYRVPDINANANVAGGGINLTQRVMECGDAGHILVSRSVAEMLRELSEWAPHLTDLGEVPAQDGTRVHVYNLVTPEAGNPVVPAKVAAATDVAAAGKSKAPLAAAAALVLLGGGVAVWLALRPKPAPQPQPQAQQLVSTPMVLNYKTESDQNGIRFLLSSPGSGYLYILNYGEDKGKWTFALLQPRNHGSAKRPAGETLQVPEHGAFGVNTPADRNTPYLVFSAEAIPDLEALKILPQQNGVAIVDDPRQIAEVQAFLKRYHSKASQKGPMTELRTGDQVLVHEISLDR